MTEVAEGDQIPNIVECECDEITKEGPIRIAVPSLVSVQSDINDLLEKERLFDGAFLIPEE